MAGRGIGMNELSPALQKQILANTSGGIIINNTPENVYNIVFNEQDLITNLVFVDGVYIVKFDPDADVLTVYKDGIRLIEGIDYEINENNISIDSLKGGWIITEDVDTTFSFVVKSNGSSVATGIGIATIEEIVEMFNSYLP